MSHLFSTVVLTAICSACGGSSSKGANQPGSPSGTNNAASKSGQEAAKDPTQKDSKSGATSSQNTTNPATSASTGSAASLKGRWLDPCYVGKDSQGSYDSIYEISDTEIVVTNRAYSDANCTAKLYENKYTSTYRLGKANQNIPDAVDLDQMLTKSTVSFFDQAIADQANAGQKQAPSAPCNQIVFKLNTETDTTSCEKANSTIYTIVKISAAELVFGSCSDQQSSCSTAALRATTLSQYKLKPAQ